MAPAPRRVGFEKGVTHEKEDHIGFDYFVVRVDGGALGGVCSGGERGKERGEHTAASHRAGANPDN